MANLTKSLIVQNGQEYEFVGKHWFGYCTTLAETQTKTVTISGFNSSDLVNGTQVTIRFLYGQTFNGAVLLRINTGSYYVIAKNNGTIGQYEWAAGETITFVYYSTAWYIINSGHADTTYFGKTKLSNTIADDEATALTPKAVYDAGYVNASGAAAAAPVQSVNGQTGAVSLSIPTVPTNVSAFNNDSGYLTLATLPIWDGGVI